MNAGFQLKYLWHDEDVFRLAASASNGRFMAAARPYAAIYSLAGAAEAVEGFPRDSSDVRELHFGSSGDGTAGGAVHLRFFCAGLSAQAVVELRFEDECERNSGSRWNRPDQSALFFGWTEAFAVDEFVAQLRRMERNKSGEACLRFHERGL